MPFHKKSTLYVQENSSGKTVLNYSSINLFPNPANNQLTIQYHLDNSIESARIELFEVGTPVLIWQLPLSQTIVTKNIVTLPIGFYLYRIIANCKVLQRGKLIIIR